MTDNGAISKGLYDLVNDWKTPDCHGQLNGIPHLWPVDKHIYIFVHDLDFSGDITGVEQYSYQMPVIFAMVDMMQSLGR
jgi:hypothetical protein